MIEVYCDGGARGNPGPAAYGFVVKKDDRLIHEEGGFIGNATNNFAEYTAVIKALEWLEQNLKGGNLNFYLDSQLVASQLSGIYKIKNANIRLQVFKVKSLETSFGQISYQHIPRAQNKEADKLVNLALDNQVKSWN